ncbi:hypothetical protein BCU71_23530 [Vibrio lentus]|uniref:hypothetical protein n=1 Tax=Vibrio lentus TaxID=136468 RepID=UPI0007EEC089|nr:hypothetical protein [Vibrio lentus]OBS95869.1 hypothetical protein A9261_17070 [Vibrio tasmaniensis]PMH26179.1 hypothetical protein BCU71_23530 [Vibrio lentus]PMI58849.1 hypothetical protein BCU41_23415 [Vibrio lentus]PMI89294.1 hypothetical protein BCU35_23280 [Vibrio lentus]PMK64920.1 hypothetical protein BCT93_24850 [Vibrio lentus]
MIEVKCLKFTYSAKLPKGSVSSYSFDGKFLDLVVNNHTVSPYLKLTSTSNNVSEYYSSDMIHGYIEDLFNIVECNVKEADNYISINAIFTIEFGLDDQVTLDVNELVYCQEEGNYSYEVTGSFTNSDSPSLSESIEIDAIIEVTSKLSIATMTM